MSPLAHQSHILGGGNMPANRHYASNVQKMNNMDADPMKMHFPKMPKMPKFTTLTKKRKSKKGY